MKQLILGIALLTLLAACGGAAAPTSNNNDADAAASPTPESSVDSGSAPTAESSSGSSGSAPTAESSSGSSGAANSPIEAAQRMFRWSYTGEGDLDELFCSTMPDLVRETMQEAVNQFAVGLTTAAMSIDLSGVTYTVENETATTATVLVEGTIRYIVGESSTEEAVGLMNYDFVFENGGWRYCTM